jgi:RNA polymerase sigma factor (sigma-70 family)
MDRAQALQLLILERLQKFADMPSFHVNEDELAARVFEKAWHRLQGKLGDEPAVSKLVDRAIQWVFVDLIRRQKALTVKATTISSGAATTAKPEQQWSKPLSDVLQQILSRMEPDDRRAILMRLERESWRSVCQTLNVPERTIQRRVARAVIQMKAQLLHVADADPIIRDALAELGLIREG